MIGRLKLSYARPRKGRRRQTFAVAAAVAVYAFALLALLWVEALLLDQLRVVLGPGLDRANWVGLLLFGVPLVVIGWKMFLLIRELAAGLMVWNREGPPDEPPAAEPNDQAPMTNKAPMTKAQ